MLKIKNKKGEAIAILNDEDTSPTFIKDKDKKKKKDKFPDEIELEMRLSKEGEFEDDVEEDTEV